MSNTSPQGPDRSSAERTAEDNKQNEAEPLLKMLDAQIKQKRIARQSGRRHSKLSVARAGAIV
ncbi:MAG: hypothetical protein ACK42E_05590, partial [Candidatus Bipolaricaulaceae bacterium]